MGASADLARVLGKLARPVPAPEYDARVRPELAEVNKVDHDARCPDLLCKNLETAANLRAQLAGAKRERDEAKSREDSAISLMTNMENERDILRESDTKLRAALDAADRLAEMVRQYAAQDAGYGASSDITTGDIGQEYEFYQAARCGCQ